MDSFDDFFLEENRSLTLAGEDAVRSDIVASAVRLDEIPHR
jgi:hypothetical protein